MSLHNVEEIVRSIHDDGIVILDSVFDASYCDQVHGILEACLKERVDSGSYCGNETNQVLDNYFMDRPELVSLIYQDLTDQVMSRLIDDDYVLISPSARNRRLMPDTSFGNKTSGMGWHTDSRFIAGTGIKPSLCYMSVLCIDDFTESNGATHFIPRSHLWYRRPEDRDADIPFEILKAPKGSLILFDTALWHRVGTESQASRWGVFNTYGPWFVKPYHRFHEMFSSEEMEKLPPKIRQLLHWDSLTPRDHNERMATLRRVGI